MSDVFRLRKIYEHIYMLTFPEQYDVNMHFLRLQEFYESPCDQFRGKPFKILDFMRWYAVERDGATNIFTYTDDWSGFNIPSWVFESLFVELNIPDENQYDVNMRAIYETIRQREGDSKFYLVGCKEKGPAIEHELAHGLWHVEPKFKSKMNRHITRMKKMHPEAYDAISRALIKEGYTPDVIDDEIQAYLSTGIAGVAVSYLAHEGYEGEKLQQLKKPFEKVLVEYRDKSDLPWIVDRDAAGLA